MTASVNPSTPPTTTGLRPPDEQADHTPPVRAQRHPDADLARPLGDAVADHAVEGDLRQCADRRPSPQPAHPPFGLLRFCGLFIALCGKATVCVATLVASCAALPRGWRDYWIRGTIPAECDPNDPRHARICEPR